MPTEIEGSGYEVIADLSIEKLEEIIMRYDFVNFESSESMKATMIEFFIKEFRKDNKRKEIKEIQDNVRGKKEVKSEKVTAKNFSTVIYTGLDSVENTYCLQEGSFVDIMSKLNYQGYAERQINLLNESLENIYALIEEAEKSPDKCSPSLKSIMKEGKVKGVIFTDERIKYTPEQIIKLKENQELFAKKGYDVEVDLIFTDKIGNRNSEIIKVDIETMIEIMLYIAEKQPNKSIYSANPPTPKEIESVGEAGL